MVRSGGFNCTACEPNQVEDINMGTDYEIADNIRAGFIASKADMIS